VLAEPLVLLVQRADLGARGLEPAPQRGIRGPLAGGTAGKGELLGRWKLRSRSISAHRRRRAVVGARRRVAQLFGDGRRRVLGFAWVRRVLQQDRSWLGLVLVAQDSKR
jgi:hypothetical protein